MGYHVNIINASISIPAEIHDKICRHLLESDFMSPANMGGGLMGADGKGEKWFSWVDMSSLRDYLLDGDLVAVLEEFRFDVGVSSSGHILSLDFDGSMGDEQTLFQYIAECLDPEEIHRIDWRSEDGSHWRWIITEGDLRSIDGVLTFPGDFE
jgi:hypothetical protein